ncbi:MAG: hypothetical protein ACK5JT_02010 [Hyphomicrobiaceae bacterium]
MCGTRLFVLLKASRFRLGTPSLLSDCGLGDTPCVLNANWFMSVGEARRWAAMAGLFISYMCFI